MKPFTLIKSETQPESEVLIEGELSVEAVTKERNKAINSFQLRLSIPGFRSGHIPEKVLVEKVGELSIFEESASIALEKHYEEIISEANIKPIGGPRVSITKISPGSAVGFKIETAIMPHIELSDYKKIAKEVGDVKEEIKIEDGEITDSLNEMRRSVAHHQKHHSIDEKDSSHDGGHEHNDHDDHSGKDIADEDLPTLDDEFAKKIGPFETLDILKEKMRESMLNEKKVKAREKVRLSIIEKIIESSTISVPKILVESELAKMISEFKANIERMGMSFDDYMKHLKKSEDDLKSEWKIEAEKRARIQLALNQIAINENLKADEEIIKKEVATILTQYKDVDKVNVELYVRNVLLNESVWEFLESQK